MRKLKLTEFYGNEAVSASSFFQIFVFVMGKCLLLNVGYLKNVLLFWEAKNFF